MNLCQYQNFFGAARTGVHSYRVFNLALVDILATFLGAFFLQRWVFPKKSYKEVLFGLFLVGIFMHWVFCVPTTLSQWLGLA